MEKLAALENEFNVVLASDPEYTDNDELVRLSTELTDFHGHLISLQQWTLVNMTAASKILKKHDKREMRLLNSDLLTRKACLLMPSILKAVSKQPWCMASKTIKSMTLRVESMAQRCLQMLIERSQTLAQRVMSMDLRAQGSTTPSSDDSEAESARNVYLEEVNDRRVALVN